MNVIFTHHSFQYLNITGGDKQKQDGIKAVLSNFVGVAGCDLKRSQLDCFIRETVRETYPSTGSSLPGPA
jgi:hypothetical protein